MSAPPTFDAAWLARIEDAGINASAPRQQRWVDGWLVRTSPGKAKRARCVQAVSAGRLPLDERLASCLALYRDAELQPYVRITPFSHPPSLDADLAERGWQQIDDTRVMVATGDAGVAHARLPDGMTVEPIEVERFVEWIAAARGSSEVERAAHADRVAHAPVPHRAFVARAEGGRIVAGGQLVIEDTVAGFYDVMTLPEQRGRGIARSLCASLLVEGRRRGAMCAYLQVDAGNAAAIAVYERLGFTDGYHYHYRTLPEAAA